VHVVRELTVIVFTRLNQLERRPDHRPLSLVFAFSGPHRTRATVQDSANDVGISPVQRAHSLLQKTALLKGKSVTYA
jgi:hypothetical protein